MHPIFLLVLFGALASGATIGPEDQEDMAPQTVVILGAGMAGMTAAKTLSDQGYKVTVLEARDRIGGRVHTTTDLGPDFNVELGAQWIHGVKLNPVAALAAKNGLALSADAGTQVYYRSDGRPWSPKEESAGHDFVENMLDDIAKKAERLDKDASLGSFVFPYISSRAGTADQQDLALSISQSDILQEYAADLNQLSAWHWDDDSELKGGDAILKKGYSSIFDSVRNLPNVEIKLGTPATSVVYGDGDACSTGVTVNTESGSYTADKLIVAVPLGQLKANAVRFSPPLPPAHAHAISKLGFGVLDKLIMRFDRPFWPAEIDWHSATIKNGTSSPLYVEYFSMMGHTNLPILVFFTAGTQAIESESLSDQQRVNVAMGQLRKMFGATIPEPLAYVTTRWHADQYTRGSYSYHATGSGPKDRMALAKPVCGQVFFAGEHVNRQYPGTVHGAYLSGVEAAQQVAKN